MATYKVVDADKLDADLTSVADKIRNSCGSVGKMVFPDGYKKGIDDVYSFAYESGNSTGYFTGHEEGYSIGYSEGNQAGYNDGYDDGYEEGAKNSLTPPASDNIDADTLYRTTRPSYWLELPRPSNNEIYMLGLLYENVDNVFLGLVYANCTIEIGTIVNGSFVAKDSVIVQPEVRFTKHLNYGDYGNTTEHGENQYVVRVTGQIDFFSFLSVENVRNPNTIVDIACGIRGLQFEAGCTGYNERAMQSLRYVRFLGDGQTGWLTTKYAYCKNLLMVSAESGTPNAIDIGYAFYQCKSLMYVSNSVLGKSQNNLYGAIFETSIGDGIRFPGTPTDTSGMFYGTRITRFDGSVCNTTKTNSYHQAFQGCRTLVSAKDLYLTSVTNASYMFNECYALKEVLFAGDTTVGGFTIDLKHAQLGHTALVNMINSLPTATSAATINITSNPGASALTDGEIAIATAKNWTITR